MADRSPALLLQVADTRVTPGGEYVITDNSGAELTLALTGQLGRDTVNLLPYIQPELMRNASLLALFRHMPETGRLAVQPLTFIQGERMVRLLY
ncbi:hypothetical protein D3C73_1449280 [compost metagenome]